MIGHARPHLLKNDSRKVDIVTGNSKKLTLGFKNWEQMLLTQPLK